MPVLLPHNSICFCHLMFNDACAKLMLTSCSSLSVIFGATANPGPNARRLVSFSSNSTGWFSICKTVTSSDGGLTSGWSVLSYY